MKQRKPPELRLYQQPLAMETLPIEGKLCRLDSGEIVVYDACSEGKRSPFCEEHKEQWEYLGEGVIDLIEELPQPGIMRHHFYKRK